ncbi:TPA: DUF2971 domain-containing protein [Vibrio parahaemolyticus]
MEDNEIIDCIRNGYHSRIRFLDDTRTINENEYYLGYRYFLLESKGKDTKEVFEGIVSKYNDESKALDYLGSVAQRIYYRTGEEHIALSLYINATKIDSQNSKAWWGIFLIKRCCKAFFNAIKIDYENNRYASVIEKITSPKFWSIKDINYSKHEWETIVTIVFSENISCEDEVKELLILAYYYLGETNKGIDLINSLDVLRQVVISKYLDDCLIDKETAISKLNLYQTTSFFNNDHERIYEEYSRRALTSPDSHIKIMVIQKAFRAKKYSDLISFYEKESDSDQLLKNDIKTNIYYLISQAIENVELNKDSLNYINKKKESIKRFNSLLYKSLRLSELILSLKTSFEILEYKECQIEQCTEYQYALELLEDPELLNHYIYDTLYEKLDKISEKWNDEHFKYQLNVALKHKTSSEYSYDDFIDFCDLGIRNKHYKTVIEEVRNFHKNSDPTIETFNILGICYEKINMHREAIENYESSISEMEINAEFEHVILENYLQFIRKNNIKIDSSKYKYLREKLNTSLIDSFKWDDYHSNRKLFKYYPFNLNTLDSLINKYFYLPSKTQLNDPIEMPKIKDIGKEGLIDSNYRICSFSKNENSMLMWSHYTENHSGIMIEYEFDGELPSGICINSVKYTNAKKRNREQNKYIFDQFLLTKNHEWYYEEEIRLVSYQTDRVYYESYEYPLSKEMRDKVNAKIVSITLGCKFPVEKEQLILNIVNNLNSMKGPYEKKVKIRKARISDKSIFDLEYVDFDI